MKCAAKEHTIEMAGMPVLTAYPLGAAMRSPCGQGNATIMYRIEVFKSALERQSAGFMAL